MLHPDKANGQQAHDTTRVSVVLRALLLGLFLGVVGLPDPVIAETAVLKEVRMGDHGKYARVVFEFSAPIQYQLSENAAAGSVSIRFLETTSELSGSPVSDVPDCINTVSTLQDGSNTIANISFDPKGVKQNPFMIKGPDRVVLDIFCEEEPVPVVTASLPEPRDITPAPITATAPLPDKPVMTRPPVEQKPVLKKPSPKKDYSQKYLLLLLAAITGIIVLVIALIIFQRKNLLESHDATRDTDDMMHTIDTKIKEKLMKYDE